MTRIQVFLVRGLIALLVFLFVAGGAYFLGRADGKASCALVSLAVQKEVVVDHGKKALAGGVVADKTAKRAAKIDAAFLGINKEVAAYVQKNNGRFDDFRCVLDADGVRLWGVANAGDFVGSARIGDANVRGVAAVGFGADDGFTHQSYRGGEFVSPLRVGASGVDRVDYGDAGANPEVRVDAVEVGSAVEAESAAAVHVEGRE